MTPRCFALGCLAMALLPLRGEARIAWVPEKGSPPTVRLQALREQVVIRGLEARIHVDLVLENPGEAALAAHVLFPLPAGARAPKVVTKDGPLPLRVLSTTGDREELEGLLERAQDPTLLAHLHDDAVWAGPLRLAPQETRSLRVAFRQDVATQGPARLLRLAPPAGSLLSAGGTPYEMEIDLETPTTLGPIYCPSVGAEVQRTQEDGAWIRWRGTLMPAMDDVLLCWAEGAADSGGLLLSSWPSEEEEGYFLLQLELYASEEGLPTPHSIRIAVDTSESMAGQPIEIVRQALLDLLGDLSSRDRVQLVACGNQARRLFERPEPMSPARRLEARAFLHGLEAQGGTNLEEALLASLVPPAPGEVAAVVLITDGRPTAGAVDPAVLLELRQELDPQRQIPILALGLGVDISASLLEALAVESGGDVVFAASPGDLEARLDELGSRLRAPALGDFALDLEDLGVTQVLPSPPPLFARGHPLVVAGRYRRDGPVEVGFSGRSGALNVEHRFLAVTEPRGAASVSIPMRLWAQRKIAQTLTRSGGDPSLDPEAMTSTLGLSKRFGILTEYTTFLAGVGTTTKPPAGPVARLTPGEAEGVARVANNANRRWSREPPPRLQSFLVAAPGGRSLERVVYDRGLEAGGRLFTRREGGEFVEVALLGLPPPGETINRWSEAFFRTYWSAPASVRAIFALPGPTHLLWEGRPLRVVDPPHAAPGVR